ncbi:hypothetical protein OAP83_02710 [Rickettsiales bacterium]|nr:hypothetical protein [Rickettsiales bacterium]
MSRNNHSTPATDIFFKEFESFTQDFDKIDKVFKEEQKRGSVSKGTCQSFENLYNQSHLREKYILALAELDTRLSQSRRPEKNQYLDIVKSQLDRLYKKDTKDGINQTLRNPQKWLAATSTQSISNNRNRIRKNAKGGIEEIRQKLIKTLTQAKDLNKSAIGNKYIGEILEEINRKVISSNKSHLYAKIGGVGITSITASLLEHYENYIGKSVKDYKVNGDRPFSDESNDKSYDQPELTTGNSDPSTDGSDLSTSSTDGSDLSSSSTEGSDLSSSSTEGSDLTLSSTEGSDVSSGFEFDSSNLGFNSSSASSVSSASSETTPTTDTSGTGNEIGDSPGGDEFDTEMVEIVTSNLSLSVWYYVLIIAIALAIAYTAYHIAERHEESSKNTIVDKNVDEALTENLDKKMNAKTGKYEKRVGELEKIKEFLDPSR